MGGLFGGQAAGLEAQVQELSEKYKDALVVKKIDAALVSPGPFRNRLASSYDRTRSDSFKQLAEQINASGGNVDPVCVRVRGDGYEVIYGYRRWQVCLQDSLPLLAIVFESLSDDEAMVLQYYENQSREDPAIVELGRQAADWVKEAGYGNASKVAQRLEITPPHLSNLVLIGSLPDDLMEIHPDPQTISFRAARMMAVLHRDNASAFKARLQLLRKKTPIPSPAEATAFLVAMADQEGAGGKKGKELIALKAEVKDGQLTIPTKALGEAERKRFLKLLQEAAKKAGIHLSL